MTFSAGMKLGTYEIVGLLGTGGMGEVYRARDSRLKREVAIKVLPEAFARDPERVARFQREAEVLASLNHPHIAAIHHLEEFEDSRLLILELVEGETLAERIARGPISLDETLIIAKQIAEALEAAHEEGIAHRDLKPANIKLTPRGAVKVLDFGLAKFRGADSPSAVLTNSPTLTTGSMYGTIMGTAAYMSPEQVKGKEADRTSDIWAFGCVVYEMLTGHRLFEGETVNEIFAGILKAEPDWLRLPPGTSEGVRRLLSRCLRKDKQERLQHMGDARIEIAEIQSAAETVLQPAPRTSRRRERLAWSLLLAFVLLVAVIASVLAFRLARPLPEMRFEINTPPTRDPASFAISPDGQKIVFVATSEGQPRLWVRWLNSVSVQPLAGTDGASYPFWSPDSRAVGFFAGGNLKRVDISGGSLQTLARSGTGRSGAWSPEGVIVFSGNTPPGHLFRVSATGEPVAVTQLQKGSNSHRVPQFLPGGRNFLFYVQGVADVRGVYAGSLDGGEPRRLFDADVAATYMFGHLLFVREGTLFAQKFDPDRLEITGDPFPVAEDVGFDPVTNAGAVSTSASGTLAYRTRTEAGQRQLVWFDRSGREIGRVGVAEVATLVNNHELSLDGRRVAVQRAGDIWLIDTARGVRSRFTFDAALDYQPVWSPDGSQIVFASTRKGGGDLYRKPASAGGNEEPLLETPQTKTPTDWSRDGRFLLYRSIDPKRGFDIWALPMTGDRKPFPVVQTDFEEREGQFSPDGKWVAYQSNESGRFEIYVQPFPGPGGKWQVSANGGAQPRWRRDGKELFYIGFDSRLMAAPIAFPPGGQTVEAGPPASLFATRIVGGALQGPSRAQYAVSTDGQRFLINSYTEEAATPPITLILNWKPPAQ